MITPSKTSRRPLKFRTPAELDADLKHLQGSEYRKLGNWSLPQACRHLAVTIESNLEPAASEHATPEESAMKEKFFGVVLNPAGMPENMPIGNPALIPPDDCTDAEIDRLSKAFQMLETVPHKYIKVGRCGPVPIAELTAIHLAHCAHHLSFLEPVRVRRELQFTSVDDVIADVNQLRQGYIQVGQWALPQMCRHLRISTINTAKPATQPATPEQAARRSALEQSLATGKISSGIEAPEPAIPPADCTDADVDSYVATLQEVRNYDQPTAVHRLFGPISNAEFHRVILIHAAHHLSYLIPAGNHDPQLTTRN